MFQPILDHLFSSWQLLHSYSDGVDLVNVVLASDRKGYKAGTKFVDALVTFKGNNCYEVTVMGQDITECLDFEIRVAITSEDVS